MKKISLALLFILVAFTFQCCESAATESVENSQTRAKTISSLMKNDAYMNEVMDSMRMNHSDAMMNNMMAKGGKEKMMNNMMEMCKTDSSMCKMMMAKTMDMCESDSSMCKMMMGSMKSHPKVMKSMEGMNNMKGMKMK